MMKCTASFGYAGRDYDSLRSLVCFVLSILLRFSRTLGDSQWRYLNHRFRTLLHGSRTPNHRFGLVLSVLTPRGFSFAVCKKRYMLSHISLFGFHIHNRCINVKLNFALPCKAKLLLRNS